MFTLHLFFLLADNRCCSAEPDGGAGGDCWWRAAPAATATPTATVGGRRIWMEGERRLRLETEMGRRRRSVGRERTAILPPGERTNGSEGEATFGFQFLVFHYFFNSFSN